MKNKKQIAFFERYLTLWVILCIIFGVILGKYSGDDIVLLSNWNINSINIPIAILVFLMIFPMMVQIDFSSLKNIKKNSKGVGLTLAINWLIKPFTMAFFAWLFFSNIYEAILTPEQSSEYIAGAILLGAAPCTAMVFVWSYLSDGDPNYTLVQVSVNDLILLVAFIPIVKFLLNVTDIEIPFDVLWTSLVVFVIIPLMSGFLVNQLLIHLKGKAWFKNVFLPKLKPFSIIALLITLVLIFAFQGKQIIENPFHIILISIPLAIQTYFIFFISWYIGKNILKIPYCINAPSGMIGSSNFFELAVAVAISLFGLNSGATLATVVGVLIEVPIMLSLVSFANRNNY
ncbi:MAG: ACR3 family arsenite efflux transporter [Flavobacteriales bacterium]